MGLSRPGRLRPENEPGGGDGNPIHPTLSSVRTVSYSTTADKIPRTMTCAT